MQPLALPTPVSAKALNRTLQRYDPHLRDYLVSGFTFGFDLGIQGDIAIQPAHTCNHASALANPDIAKSKIDREVVLGRIGGPFPLQSQQQVVISPLALIPKREPGKFRLIHDLSFPKGESINSTIPREFTTVHYDSIDNVISLVKRCGERCLMSKSDLSEASGKFQCRRPNIGTWGSCGMIRYTSTNVYHSAAHHPVKFFLLLAMLLAG